MWFGDNNFVSGSTVNLSILLILASIQFLLSLPLSSRHPKQVAIYCYAVSEAKHPSLSKQTVPHYVLVQKISIPLPWMVIGNSERVGVGREGVEILGRRGGGGVQTN